jgi:hypothetical protein
MAFRGKSIFHERPWGLRRLRLNDCITRRELEFLSPVDARFLDRSVGVHRFKGVVDRNGWRLLLAFRRRVGVETAISENDFTNVWCDGITGLTGFANFEQASSADSFP